MLTHTHIYTHLLKVDELKFLLLLLKEILPVHKTIYSCKANVLISIDARQIDPVI